MALMSKPIILTYNCEPYEDDFDIGTKVTTFSHNLLSRATSRSKWIVSQEWQQTAFKKGCNQRIRSVANACRNNVPATIIFLILLVCLLFSSVQCHFHGRPLNIAAKTGERVIMKCASHDTDRICGNLAWVYYSPKTLKQIYVLMQGQVSRLVSDYISLINSTEGNCDLEIKAHESTGGKYECISPSTAETASAELIVLENHPECVIKTDDEYFNVTCSIRFFGHWPPMMEWIRVHGQSSHSHTHIISSRSTKISDELISSTNLMPRFKMSNEENSGFKCFMKFSELGRPSKTTASNVPRYQWTSPMLVGIKEKEFQKIDLVNCGEKTILFGFVDLRSRLFISLSLVISRLQ